ncbi:WD40-repeat-containing domain protein [Gymnopilus junonius]|uniref:Glutamate-rich WD repeat-containing protein 1 n=1 Tax=Gymnopilus junonius TaxID=109634 RepID=A0A9P5TIN3_GYMJU|nr:WD40-repeat-containing domain protein [Gymnopilus junonius]
MVKRPQRPTEATKEDQRSKLAKHEGVQVRERVDLDDDQAGEFEDPWEDEIESEDEEGNRSNEMDIDSETEKIEEEGHEPQSKPFILGVDEVPEGHTLEADDSVYIMRHNLSLEWSCLSFDVLRDNLGDERHQFPTSAYIVAGSQAHRAQDNVLFVAKMSSLHRTQTHDDSDEDDDEDDDALDEDPIVEHVSIPHAGVVNRVRTQRLYAPTLPPASQSYFTATFSETGKVHIYNVRPLIESLDVPGYSLDKDLHFKPPFTINSHSSEGYAMDWNAPSASSLSLLTGDNDAKIYLTTASNSDFRVAPRAFTSHMSSVEDLQWSPTEITVFASCSSDRSIRVWDIRSTNRQNMASISEAHSSDVNVISWNRSTSYLLVSGDDNGEIKVWDLRNIKDSKPHVVQFNWHKRPITSIEWHPTEDSVFAASGDDHQVSLWDLALEADDDVMASDPDDASVIPPQLLFTHHHECVKELHWHPQIPDALLSTGIDAVNIFKPVTK